MAVLVFLALFLSFTSYSSAQYCLCKPGSQAPDPYKKVIDYACGNGANCGPIQSNGPCYQANDVQALCSYAANSYYQNKKSQGATCDFGGVAAPGGSLPTGLPSGCSYPTSAGPVSTGPGISTSSGGGGGGGGVNGVNTGTYTGMGPTSSFTDPNDATSLLQISSCIVSLSLTFVTMLLILRA
ncbi:PLASMODESMATA CALLOSE-BINDING PROTEIN 4-like [Silene latifolia]|uniref:PLASMODESMATA CALLOSE-BINDING PROTEIN 4-like n=1 Tax=Silene latifolia TaxID=37657 RepID=UPI003D77B46F